MASKAYRPWHPVTVKDNNDQPATHLELRKTDCVALQAVWNGNATPEQQRAAVVAILHLCAINDLEFLPAEHGGERDSVFKSGMRHVGLQLRKLTTFPLNLLTGEVDGRDRNPDRRRGKPSDGRNVERAKQ